MQTSLFRGSRTVTSLRLCSRAPWTTSSSESITDPVYPGGSDRTSVRSGGREAAPGAAPGPLFGLRAEPRAHGIEEDVLACAREVFLGLDRAGGVPAGEEVAEAC